MKVIFLDYDGVVNTPIWDAEGKVCTFAYSRDNKVNNFQAVQWLSELCQKFDYKLVITSTWRLCENYKECLINGGLREGIQILGATPRIHSDTDPRPQEIKAWLKQHPEVTDYLVIDDEFLPSADPSLSDKFIHCDYRCGFLMPEYLKAEKIAKILDGSEE